MTQPGTILTSLRSALQLGAFCIGLGALGWTWEILALQAPSSAWHVSGFPAAIDRFAQHAWIEGLTVFALAPRAWRARFDHRPWHARALLVALYAGTALALGSLAYSSATGVLGIQIRDTARSSHGLLTLRLAGEGLLLATLGISAVVATRDP